MTIVATSTGINNSLSLQKSWYLPPPLVSAERTLESLARDTTPPCPLPLSPTSLTFNESSNRNGVSSSTGTVTATFSSSKLRLWDARHWIQNLSPRGVVSDHQLRVYRRTALRKRQWRSLPEEANGMWESRKKRQRQNHTHHWDQFTRAVSRMIDSRQNLDANQSHYSYIRWRTRIPRIMCACTSGISRYIKTVA